MVAATPLLHAVSAVLCLGAHPDDIEIGCGGTLAKLRSLNPRLEVTFVVFSADETRAGEARESAASFAGDRDIELIVKSFRESYFTYEGAEIKDYFNELAERRRPDVVFTHYRHDRHQDHRLLSDLTWNTFREHVILEYEIPKYDGDVGVPNAFVPLNRSICDTKITQLERCFGSQTAKPWFSRETFMATLRLRGIECRSPGGYAEAFYARKLVLA